MNDELTHAAELPAELLEPASDLPMRGEEFLRLATRLGIDCPVTYEITIAATINAVGERDPIEAIVTEYVTDDDGLILFAQDGEPMRRSRVVVLRSLEASV